MARLRVVAEIVQNMLFGYSENPVRITGINHDKENDVFIFDLKGKDIPETNEEIRCVITQHRNNAGQVWLTMKFE